MTTRNEINERNWQMVGALDLTNALIKSLNNRNSLLKSEIADVFSDYIRVMSDENYNAVNRLPAGSDILEFVSKEAL